MMDITEFAEILAEGIPTIVAKQVNKRCDLWQSLHYRNVLKGVKLLHKSHGHIEAFVS